MEIKTKEDWWALVDSYWDSLCDIIAHHMMMLSPAYETPGKDHTPQTGRTISAEIDFLKENKDPKLARYFHASWVLASDAYAYSVPGWAVLCDLCSEDWVFHEEPPDNWVPPTRDIIAESPEDLKDPRETLDDFDLFFDEV